MRVLKEGVKSMKVTVCFGAVRVVVPCADGTLSVGDLRDKAISRFLKATGRSPSQWIHVQKLITSPDGGILDPNDRLRDVVDDRDQIIAIFEEQKNTSLLQHSGGDGTSVSSVSASSPEMFHDDHVNENDVKQDYTPRISKTDVIITSQDMIAGSKLMVRRVSEPVLNLDESEARVSCKTRHCGTRSQPSNSPDELQELDSDSGVSGSDITDQKKSQSLEAKDAQLLDFACENMTEAVNSDKLVFEVQDQTDHLNRAPTSKKLPDKEGGFTGRSGVAFRYSSIEDLDGSCFWEAAPPLPPRKHPPTVLQKTIASGRTNTRLLGRQITLQLVKGPHGLGFTVTTRDNPTGGNCPIYVKNIKPQGAAIESGLLQPGDRLLQVNDVEITGKSQSKVVSILRSIPEGSTVDLVISRQEFLETNLDQPQQTAYIDNFESMLTRDSSGPGSNLASAAVKEGNRSADDVDIFVFDVCLNSVTAVQGLGVSLKGKTASTPEGSKELGVFVKSVIDEGAADKDGRLRPDDQLLEVNGECLLNHTTMEATRILRSALLKETSPPGYVKLIVARKKDGTSDSQVNFDCATAKEAKKRGQMTSFHPRPMSLQEFQQQNGQLRVSGSRSLHNLSYQQAIDNAVLHGILLSGDNVVQNSVSEMVLNGGIEVPDRMGTVTKRSQVAHNTEKSDNEKNDSREQLDWDCKNSDVTQDTSSSDIETRPAFQREGFGRQSMSEKRKGHLDPRTTEVYQKIRQNKGRFCSASLDRHKTKSKPFEDISISAEETKPSLASRKSTSLESLKAAFQEPDPASKPSKDPVDSQGRPCGTNNSFRAAVDQSYENNLDSDETPLNEAETNTSSDEVSNLNNRSTSSKDLAESQGRKKDKGRGLFKGISGILRLGRSKKADSKLDDLHSQSLSGGRDEVKVNTMKSTRLADSSGCPVSRSSSESKPIPINPSTKPDDPRVKKKSPASSKSATPSDQMGQLISTSAPSRDPVGVEVVPPDLFDRRCPPSSEKVLTESPSANRLIQLRQEYQRHHRERHHQYPLDAQEEEYELKLRELERQQALLLERENLDESPTVQYRAGADMPPGSRNPYLERPTSCGNHYQNIDIVRSQLQLHDEYQLRYQAQMRYQQQLLWQQQQQSVVVATRPPIRHQYSHSYSPQPSRFYHESGSPAVFRNCQKTPGVLQNRKAIPMALQSHKGISGPIQNQEIISMALQNHKRVPGPLQNCDVKSVRLQICDADPQALGNHDSFYYNRNYEWNQVRDIMQNPLPSNRGTDQRAFLGHDGSYSGFASHSKLPTGFEQVFPGNRPAMWKANDSEHYYSSNANSVGQRPVRRDHHYY